MTEQNQSHDTLKTFLILIMLQMMPLIALEARICAVSDPVGLLCRFGSKVLLMHVCFLAMRICNAALYDMGDTWTNCAGLVAACVALHIGFNHRWTLKGFIENKDVWCLVGIAITAAVVTEQLDKYFRPYNPVYWNHKPISLMIGTASDYTEIVAFVPAVWMAFRAAKDAPPTAPHDPIARRRAVSFFAFVIGWYVMEDLTSAFECYQFAPLGAIGHILHFVLLLDFAGFLLAHLYDPQKLKINIMSWFPDGCVV